MTDQPLVPGLAEFPVTVRLPIYWGDIDVYGHVNSTVYLRWFEAARAAYALRIGLQIQTRDCGIGVVMASVTCNFRRQLDYPGEVAAGARVTRLSLGNMTMDYRVVDINTGLPAADGSSVLVAYDFPADRPVSVPDDVRVAIERLEDTTFSGNG
jgi:acyl-CoA thioester hydrolase